MSYSIPFTPTRYMKESTYGHDYIDPVIKSGRNPYPFMPGRIPANAYGPQRPDTDYSPRGQLSPHMSPRRDEYSDPYMSRGPPEPQINTYVSPRESEQQRYGNVSPGGRPMNNTYDRSPRLNMYERHTHPPPRPDMYDRPSHPSPRPDMVDQRGMPQWQRDSRYNQYRPTQKDYGQYAEMQMQEKSLRVQHGSGVYMFMRTQMGEALNDCKMAIVKREHILKQAPGHLKGIAKKEKIFLLESDDEGDWRLESHSTNKTDNCVFVLWFPTYEVAKNWILYDKDFSKSNFPQQYGSEVFIVPVMKNPLDDRACPTFLMTEFPGVRDFKAFAERVEERFERAASRYDGHANVVFSDRNFHVRGKWVSPNNPIVIHRFKKPIDAFDFYKDNEVRLLRDSLMQSGICRGRPRSVIFSLDEFM